MSEQPAREYLQGRNGVAFVVTCAILTPILAATIPMLFLLPLSFHRMSEPGYWVDILLIWGTFSGGLALTGVVPGVVAVIVLVGRLWRGERLYYSAVSQWAGLCSAVSFPLSLLLIQFLACFGWSSGSCPVTDGRGWLAPLTSIVIVLITVPLGVGSATLLWWAWGAIFGRSFETPVAAGPISVTQGNDAGATEGSR